MFLALKEMKKEKTRFIMIILVTVLIAYLVYFLSSLAFGLAQINRTAVNHWDATGIILTKSSNENIYASMIDEEVVNQIGYSMEETVNVSTSAVTFEQAGEEPEDLILMGFDFNNKRHLPNLTSGEYPAGTHEALISQNIKDRLKVELGDTIELLTTGRQFTITGFTEDSNYNTRPVIYVEQAMASAAMAMYTTGDQEYDAISTPTPNMPNRVSGVLTSDIVDQSILDDYDLQYLEIDTFINSLPGYQAQVLTFGLMIVSLVIIAAIIIGIFMYILTMQKRHIFGVLRIQGFKNGTIIQSVVFQTILVILLGFALGFIFTLLTITFMPKSVPVAISWELFGIITLFSLISSLIGTTFSSRSILKIDPLEAL
ncbi:MAG TPA: ABC transporter permease [Erysipelothrix sp.]|jgi:putative ABC transport system permease protein|nr:ABC transporter permease [Erysipelothrix sp.]